MKCHCTEVEELRAALREIVNVLGPDRICSCASPCEGLRVEADEALQVARRALGLTDESQWGEPTRA